MNPTLSIDAAMPLVAVLGIVTLLLIRSRDVRIWEATVIGLFGFYLAMTPIGWTITGVTEWLLGSFLGQ